MKRQMFLYIQSSTKIRKCERIQTKPLRFYQLRRNKSFVFYVNMIRVTGIECFFFITNVFIHSMLRNANEYNLKLYFTTK